MHKTKKIFEWVIPILIGFFLALILRNFVISMVKVDGSSMNPNLHNNERVILLRQKRIKRFSVIVFDTKGFIPDSNSKFVKRVIGLPGDKISYNNQGKLYINGKYSNQGFINNTQKKSGTLAVIGMTKFNLESLAKKNNWQFNKQKPLVVPKGKYFVMGDNRLVSYDSRYWGFVPKSKINGVVQVPIWNNKRALINNYG